MSLWSRFFGRSDDPSPSADPPAAATGGSAPTTSDPRELLVEALRCALGEGRSRDDHAAFALMLAAAEGGAVEAQRLAGVMQMFGVGTAEDGASGLSWLRKAADAGDSDARYEAGVWLEAGFGGRADSAVITGLYRAGADAGHLKCINGLRSRYNPERGVEPDLGGYLHWTRRAADLGDPQAQYELGVRHANGDGVGQDFVEAVAWYERAASQGDALACHNLAVHAATGQGVEKDLRRAAEWYQRASDLGVTKSCRTLAAMYFHGQGVIKDPEKAARLSDRADELERQDRAPTTPQDAARTLAAIHHRREQTVRDMLQDTWRRLQGARRQENSVAAPDPTRAAIQAGTAVELLVGFLDDRVGYTLRSGSVSFGQAIMRPSDPRLIGHGVGFVFRDTALTVTNGNQASALLHLCLNLQDRLVGLPLTGKEPRDAAGQLVMEPIRALVRFGPSADLSVSMIDGIRHQQGS